MTIVRKIKMHLNFVLIFIIYTYTHTHARARYVFFSFLAFFDSINLCLHYRLRISTASSQLFLQLVTFPHSVK